MFIKNIYLSSDFLKQFNDLPVDIQKKASKKEKLFKENAFYPSLRLHKLEGKLNDLWSISIDMRYRIIFKPMGEGDILFISIGIHSIYNK